MEVTLKKVEKEYDKALKNLIGTREVLTPKEMIDLCQKLFNDITIKGMSAMDDDENDMLLYQYGTYDWGDELGKHFSFDITRQFANPKNYNLYQLSLTLIYTPELFENIQAHSCWSAKFSDITKFFAHIESTEGFKLVEQIFPKSCILKFSQC